MIPSGGSKYLPWLPIKKGMKIKIMTEPAPKDNPKLKSPFYCDVNYDGAEYALGLNWTSYAYIAKNYGRDTSEWVGRTIEYKGQEKTKMGSMAHVWFPTEDEINLDAE